MSNVRNILSGKGKALFTISPDTLVIDALQLMYEKNVSALLITVDDKLVGIFSERDYARKLILQGKSSKDTYIHEIMTEDLITVTPDTSIDTCMRLMTNHFIRHLPVLEGTTLVGILSIGDVVKFIIEEQKFIIENLEHYITGT
jgi:CBS domain-containing protein